MNDDQQSFFPLMSRTWDTLPLDSESVN